ncbi:Serine/threonine-protein kinase PknH [compost metagenome]
MSGRKPGRKARRKSKRPSSAALARPITQSPAQGGHPGAGRTPGQLPELLCGRYKIERLLGVGGMGAVYRARDLLREVHGEPAAHVALKTLSSEFAEHPDANSLLHSEFALTSRLHHPNIVRACHFDLDPASQQAFFTLELLKGSTLDQLLDAYPSGLPWVQAREIALPLIDALIHAHAHDVLHGDIKPGNILLCEQGPILFDFGLAQLDESARAGLPQLNRQRFTALTPRYAAPELHQHAPLTAASETFAVACVLFELSCGRHPLGNRDTPERLADLRPLARLPRRAARCLGAALDSQPQKRPSLEELSDAFRKSSRKVGLGGLFRHWARTRRHDANRS